MKKPRIYSLQIGLALLLFSGMCAKHTPDRVTVGVDLPLTGPLAYYGHEVQNALTLVMKHDPSSGVEFAFEDNQSKGNVSVSVFSRFCMNRSIPMIISCNSPLSIPLRPLAEQNQKVLLALVTGARDFGVMNIWSFRDAINQDQEGGLLADYIINKTSFKNGVTFVVNDDYGLGGASAFKAKFVSLGGIIDLEETFEMNDRDMRPKLLKLLSKQPQFILVIGREQTLITSINQLREMNKTVPIITSDAFESPTVFEGLGEGRKGIIFASYYNDFENDTGRRFLADYQESFNKQPGIYAVDAYVAGSYIMDIIKTSGKGSDQLRAALSRMTYDSPIKGKLIVNEKRDVISPVAVYQIGNNYEKLRIHNY